MRTDPSVLLQSCAKDLKQIKAQLPKDLDPGLAELCESVIVRLEQSEVSVRDRESTLALIQDGLALAGRIGEVALVVAEILNRCGLNDRL